MSNSVVLAAGSSTFLGVDWGAFVVVFVVAFVAAVVIVAFYALGLRLLAIGSADDTGADSAIVSTPAGRRPAWATATGFLCLAIGIAAVLYALWLVIPQFH
jgi:hypothetical protein